ncbi:MAG: hypothetical protein ACREP8_17470, partial [Candidatus Binatia bacterium]
QERVNAVETPRPTGGIISFDVLQQEVRMIIALYHGSRGGVQLSSDPGHRHGDVYQKLIVTFVKRL